MRRARLLWTLSVCALLASACTAASEGSEGEAPGAGEAVASAPASRADAADASDRWFEPGTRLTVFGITGLANARAAPGTDSRRLRQIYSDDEIVAAGPSRWVGDRWWVQIDLPAHGQTGWVARDLVGVEGPAEDVASELPAREATLVASDVLDLGHRALRGLGYEPEGQATVLSQAPLIMDRATVAFDVRSADDTVLGDRIRVIGARRVLRRGRRPRGLIARAAPTGRMVRSVGAPLIPFRAALGTVAIPAMRAPARTRPPGRPAGG